MAPAANTPDFDNMTPEEIMAWMETLAKRQGVKDEELLTSANSDIAEVDPETAVINGPGYIPYGSTETRPPKPERKEPAAPAAPAASVPPPRQPAAPPPAAAQPPPAPVQPVTPPPAPQPEAAADDGMAWLESLAADTVGDFNLDLSSLSAELGAPAEPANPVDWLNDLAASGGESAPPISVPPPVAAIPPAPPVPEPAAAADDSITDPFASGVDPMAWLENLARRQGAKTEEMTTSVEMNIPVPENAVIDEPGYKPFSFDSPSEPRRPATPPKEEPKAAEPIKLESPTDWLSSIAGEEGVGSIPESKPASMDLKEIEKAIGTGTVTTEQMQFYLEHQTDRFVEEYQHAPELTEDELDNVFDSDAPPVHAELPDWLLEQVGAPPAGVQAPSEQPPLIDTIVQPPAASGMPDWLREDTGVQADLDLENIFADTEEDTRVFEPQAEPEMTLNYEIEVDPSDPWVEAFDLEREQGAADIDVVPDWYKQNLSDPARIAAVDRIAMDEDTIELPAANLPQEADLVAGQPEDLPDWLQAAAPAPAPSAFPMNTAPAQPAETAPISDIPDWLREVEANVQPDDIPDWLVETLDEPIEAFVEPSVFQPAAPPAPTAAQPVAPPPQPAQPVQPPPAPAPQRPKQPAPVSRGIPANFDVGATLEEARSASRGGDIDTGLVAYELLIRANAELDSVVGDLQSLVRTQRSNPAVYRVLGDGLMRQGNLQAALDIYREALNQL